MKRLKIVSYNIHRCFGMDRHYDPGRIRDVLRQLDPDIIALQEIDSSLTADNGEDQLTFLARATGMEAVIGPTLTRAYGAYGNAFLSRHRYMRIEEGDLTYRRFEPRGWLSAEIDVRGSPVRVINTHLGLKFWERKYQVERLVEHLLPRMLPGPVVLAGDMNEWFPFSPNLLELRRFFGEIPKASTFPAAWPRLALDKVFVYPRPASWRFRAVNTPETRLASDHLPVEAEFDLVAADGAVS